MKGVVSATKELPVVVGVNNLPTAMHSVDFAAAEASRRNVPLLLVHSWAGWSRGPRYRVVVPDRKQGRHLLDLTLRRAQHAYPGLNVDGDLTDDSAAKALLERSAAASLLVLGHQDAGGHRSGWGSTAAYLARHGTCPILVHQGWFPTQGPVTLAASHHTTATLELAFEYAAHAQCPLTAVHIWSSTRADKTGDRAAAEARLTETLARVHNRRPYVAAEQVLIPETAIGYTVQRASRRSRLLVAGTGRKGWSVEAVCSAYANPGPQHRCPVLLVPPGWTSAGRPTAAAATA
jgi:nucleotide-binding universal stress UspA family protein